jgi:hypothetical protein
MHVSSGLPHIHTSNHRGRGKDPVVVLGSVKCFVAVSMNVPYDSILLESSQIIQIQSGLKRYLNSPL